MMRIGLFLMTNIAVVALLAIVMQLFGLDHYLKANGGIDLISLLIMCAIFGMGGSFISLFISKWMAKRSSKTQLIEEPRTANEKWLLDTVAELSEKAGIKMPEVGIFPSNQPNAFATGWNKNAALVAVSQGMFERFPKNEVKAVMAHEIGHVANGDMVTLALVQGVMNTFVMFFARIIGYVVDRVVFKNDRGMGMGHFAVVMAAQVVLGFLASMVVSWFSRFREFRADYAGATLGDKESMMAALARLQGETLAMQQSRVGNDMPETLVAFGISGFKDNFASLFSTHPPIDKRIEAIKKL